MSEWSADGLERIWTPHRMAYVRTAVDDEGCPFCAIPGHPDDESLIVARGEATYAVLNLHPYNPGHLMVLPYRHVAELEDLTPEESAEVMSMTQQAITVIRKVSTPHAFNIGRTRTLTQHDKHRVTRDHADQGKDHDGNAK